MTPTLLPALELNTKYFDQLYPPFADKLEVLLGYIAVANPATRFVVYSRGSWETDQVSAAWVTGMERRFPRLKGRLVAYKVPLDRATFRHPDTSREVPALVVEALRGLNGANAS